MTRLRDIIASFVTQKSELKGRETPAEEPRAQNNERQEFSSEVPVAEQVEEAPLAESEDEIEVTPEFKTALQKIKSGPPFLFITGKAGTGKSTFVNLLKQDLQSYAIVAPTGVAALNVGGQTIHSFFRLAPGPVDFSKIKEVRNKIAYKALRILIIDEISMVRADLLDAIDHMLRKNGKHSGKPFGGVQVIVIGDLFQLPPIINSEEEAAYMTHGYSTPFFFSANVLKELPFETIEFTKVFRQTDESFISLLNHIREGKQLDETLAAVNQQIATLQDGEFEGIILTGTNNQASNINKKRLGDISADARTYAGEITGEFRVDKQKLPAPMELTLKVGAQVMFVKNDRARRWVNGTLGTILELENSQIRVGLSDQWGYRKVTVERDSWDNLKYEYDPETHQVAAKKVGSFKQFPLTLAWAVTIHKSQGKTFDRIHIDLGRGAFAEGQVYVALSRARTLEGISLEQPIHRDDITLNFDVIEFHRSLGDA